MPLSQVLPVIDNRRYADIEAEIRARIPRYTPEWTDFNDNDPGIALAQLFAWMSDMLLYRLGRVPELNYVKFLELLNIELRPAEPARATVFFAVSDSASKSVVEVPKGTQVSAEDPSSPRPIVFETDRTLMALRAVLKAVQSNDGATFLDRTTENEDSNLAYEPFGVDAVADSALLIGFDDTGTFPQTDLALHVVLADADEPPAVDCTSLKRHERAPADFAWEYWNGGEWASLNLLRDDTLTFTRTGMIYLRTPASGTMAKAPLGKVTDSLYWIRARLTRSAYQTVPKILGVRSNSVGVTQAETVLDEIVGGSDGSPNQTFRLEYCPVLAGSLALYVHEGIEVTEENVTIDEEGYVKWAEVSDFYGSKKTDRHFVLDRTTGEIRFGDGRRGAIPSGNPQLRGRNIVARKYRFGGGARGNVAAKAIKTLVSSIPGIDTGKIRNELAAAGGSAEETLKEAKERAPQSIRSRCRAVTNEDFEELARQAATIKRAKALPLAHPGFPGVEVPGVVSVVVVPDGTEARPTPTEATLEAVCAYLNQARLLTTELHVVPPKYRKIVVKATVIAEDSADLTAVKTAIQKRLSDYFHPLIGGEDGTGWPFGQDVFYSRVHLRATVKGVQRIEKLTLSVDGADAKECENVEICDGELTYSGEHEIAVSYGYED